MNRSTRNERRLVAIAVALMMLLTYWLSTHQTLNPNYEIGWEQFNANFFREQANSMLDGRLEVPGKDFSWNECWTKDAKCFGYFGITQSILRLPIVIVAGGDRLNFTPVFITLAAGLAMWAMLDLLLRVLRSMWRGSGPPWSMTALVVVVVALLLGPGSTLTYLASPRIYHESIIAMIAYLLVAMNFVHRWIKSRRTMHLAVAMVAAIAAASARPSAILPSVVLGLGVVFILFRDRRTGLPKNQLGLAAALAFAPGLVAAGVFWIKFGAINPPWKYYYQKGITERFSRANGGVLQGPRFFKTNLANYFRPDSIGFVNRSPWIVGRIPQIESPIWIRPITASKMYVEPVASLTNTMFLPLALTAAMMLSLLTRIVRLNQPLRRSFIILMLAGLVAPLSVLTLYSISTRYLGDFFPLVAVGTIFAAASTAHALRMRPRALTAIFYCFGLIALISFYVQLQLYGQIIFADGPK